MRTNGRVQTAETRRKISEAKMGKPRSVETRQKIREARMGKTHSLETRRKIGEAHKGKPSAMSGKFHSETARRKMSEAQKGRIISDEHRRKISETLKGNIPWNKGRRGIFSLETRQKMSEAQKGEKHHSYGKTFSEEHKRKIGESRKGEKHPLWQGGVSFEPYTTDWTSTLRRSMRERDRYVCQFCGELQGDVALDVHHIDYNKKNCNLDNLISLCRKCHADTNFNREKWKRFFEKNRGTIMLFVTREG